MICIELEFYGRTIRFPMVGGGVEGPEPSDCYSDEHFPFQLHSMAKDPSKSL